MSPKQARRLWAALALVALFSLCVGVAAAYAALGLHDTQAGPGALAAESGGDYNAGIGYNALHANTTGTYNTAVGGRNALQSNTTGYNNTAVGSDALQSMVDGHDNTGVGPGAFYYLTTGYENTAVGLNAGESLADGFDNTFLGTGADVIGGGIVNSTAVGANAKVGQSNTVVLGADGTYVGVQTSTPQSTLQVGPATDLSYDYYLQLPVTTSKLNPPLSDCNTGSAVGRLILQSAPPGKKLTLWGCAPNGKWVKI